jgi:hypothetical protein
MFAAADVSFSPDEHRYTLPNGQDVPSVTGILSAVGVTVDFEELSSRSSAIGDAITLKRDLGTAFHHDAHALDDDDLNWNTVDPLVEPYLRAWVVCKENLGLVSLLHERERIVFHAGLGFVGTMDGIFRLPNGQMILGDLKCGDPAAAATHLQTAGYALAYRSDRDGAIHGRWGIQLTPGLRVPYRIHCYADWRDELKFMACLTVFNEQPHRRGR